MVKASTASWLFLCKRVTFIIYHDLLTDEGAGCMKRMKRKVCSVFCAVAVVVSAEAMSSFGVSAATPSSTGKTTASAVSSAKLQLLKQDANGNDVYDVNGSGVHIVKPEVKKSAKTGKTGYVASTSLYGKLSDVASKKGLLQSGELPSSYDSRSVGNVPSFVKDQSPNADCWAFAGYGTLESNMLAQGNKTKYEFDESDLNSNSGWDVSSGGSDVVTDAYLESWRGAKSKNADGSETGVQTHVQGIVNLGGRNGYSSTADAIIKQAVMKYGAVTAPIYYDSSCDSPSDLKSGENFGGNYYFGGSKYTSPNHEVAIVGWDNNYSASNFAGSAGTPKDNGAFICRNSWGSDYGYAGYMYISYDDAVIGTFGFTAFSDVESTSNYDFINQYDALAGANGAISDASSSTATKTIGANVFTASSSQDLKAVSFSTELPGESYKVYLATNVDPTKPCNGSDYLSTKLNSASLVASGTSSDMGYHTVSIPTTQIAKGASYIVYVSVASVDGTAGLLGASSSVTSGSPVTVSAPLNTSFIYSSRGASWMDIGKYGNAVNSIKTFSDADNNVPATAPTINIEPYDSTDTTSSPITVTATTDSNATFSAAQGETVSADGHTASYTFSQNGSFTFKATNTSGLTTSKTVTISNIVAPAPTPTPTPTPTVYQPLLSIDTPSSGQSAVSDVVVSGWALGQKGVSSVNISLNGKQVGSVSKFSERDDVASNVDPNGNYANDKECGYRYTVPFTSLSYGSNTLTVSSVGVDGLTATKSVVVSRPHPASITDIDSPTVNSTDAGDFMVSGWVLNASGMNRVDVYAQDTNGKMHGLGSVSASSMTNRSDVAKAFAHSGYANINASGYSLKVSGSALAYGNYVLCVAGIGVDGTVQWSTVPFSTGSAPIESLDAPDSTVSGDFTVSGWALNHSGVARVDTYAFDSAGRAHFLGSEAGSQFGNRQDVANAFSNAGFSNTVSSGYNIPVSASALTAGSYTLAVANIGNDGTVSWANKSIVVRDAPIADMDSPCGTASGDFTVSGWVLNHSGVRRVDVYAWDSQGCAHFLGSENGSKFTNRQDVANAFASAGFKNKIQSGYSVNVSASQLKAGTYQISVASIGNDGDVVWASKSLVVRDAPITDIDAPHGAVGSNFTVSGWALNHSGVNRVDVYAWDSQGHAHFIGSVDGSKFTNRQDVANAFAGAGYKGKLQSGYSVSVNTSSSGLSAGVYTLAIAGIGNDGDVMWSTTMISIS